MNFGYTQCWCGCKGAATMSPPGRDYHLTWCEDGHIALIKPDGGTEDLYDLGAVPGDEYPILRKER